MSEARDRLDRLSAAKSEGSQRRSTVVITVLVLVAVSGLYASQKTVRGFSLTTGEKDWSQNAVYQTTRPYLPGLHHNRIVRGIQEKYASYQAMPVGDKPLDMTRNLHSIADFKSSTHESETSSQPQTEPDHEPLNVVLFYADDWTRNVLGVLNPHVRTPNIDQMARNGVLFDHNCVTTSICWISRATLATGVYAAIHGHVKIASTVMYNKTVVWPNTMYPLLKKHGYYTGLVGKWHAPTPREFMQDTFDVLNNYYGQHWMTRRGEKRHVTDLNGEDALKFLEQRPKDQPFALTVSFFATHAWDNTHPPYQPMPTSMEWYQNVTIPPVKTNTEEEWQKLPWFFNERNEGRKRWKRRYDTPENYQDSMKNMYRMATEVDAVVGAVVEELKKQGVYDNTLLIFTTDNGNLHGEHGLSEKWYAFDQSIQVPLVIQDPRMPSSRKGSTNSDYTLSVDLAPTILSAAKIPVPEYMQGRDMAELYMHPKEATSSWRRDFFYEWTQGRPSDGQGHDHYAHIPAVFALIRKDWKYVYWPQTKYEQLFHMESDPDEINDRFNDTTESTVEVLQLMKARYEFLKTWAQEGNPV